MLLLAYEDLDTPLGRDQSYATLESVLFQPLWPWLLQAFRYVSLEGINSRNAYLIIA